MILKLITWIILSYGLMNIMVFGKIFNNFRNYLNKWGNSKITGTEYPKYPLSQLGKFFYDMISCAMCFSVWGGFFLGIFIWSPSHDILGVSILFSWFLDGIISSGAVWAVNSIIEWFEENRN